MTLGRRRALVLFVLGLIGVVAVLPYQLALITLPPQITLQLAVISGLVNGAILLAIAVGVGSLTAPRADLGTPVIDAALTAQPFWDRIRAYALLAILLGVAAAVAIIALDAVIFAPAVRGLINGPVPAQPEAWKGLLASLYGGFTEELLLRYFVMSLLAWLIGLALKGSPRYWTAIVAASVLFGLAHLPATAALLPLTPLIVVRAVVLNGLAGVVFGWLYWRKGLEAAMLSHFSSDLVLHVLLVLAIAAPSA